MRTELQTAILRAQLARGTPQAVIIPPPRPIIKIKESKVSRLAASIAILEAKLEAAKKIETERERLASEMLLPPSLSPERINKVHKVNRIINAACRHFGIPREQLIGPSHRRELVFPRHITMYTARAFTKESFPEIGRRFDKRDHSTVWHAFHKIARLLIVDDRVAADCEDLARAIGEAI